MTNVFKNIGHFLYFQYLAMNLTTFLFLEIFKMLWPNTVEKEII